MPDAANAHLTVFEKIAILREEIEERAGALDRLERRIRELRSALERRKFLWSISPDFYKNQPPPEGAKDLANLEAERAQLADLAARLQKALEALAASLPSAGVPQAAGGTPRRHRFASFDEAGR